ncbi:hypothetical protein DBR37_04035 [Herminiimonas sp. KBW02]|uniref:hypothetical protein n=1 Tax=Herminiimonas sp. KBW02 TaxID=2153363 RepID=UPI000F5B308F|nr:hypothetical protein [Herminiimonas sp. KBW02]RQO37361.1 hypothetical protein DBR37_04035 [Herminiimonas sp. KBW02]
MTAKRFLHLALISLVITLVGCSTTPIPAKIKAQMSTSQAVVAYFSNGETAQSCNCTSGVDSNYSLTPVPNGYYRVLLGRNAEGLFLVQDFYQKNKRPQSSPVWIKEPDDIFNFNSNIIIGSATLYYPDGKILETFTNTDKESRSGEGFYKSGQRATKYVEDNTGTQFEYWYQSGKPAARYGRSASGQLNYAEAWDESGDKTENIDAIIIDIARKMDPEP